MSTSPAALPSGNIPSVKSVKEFLGLEFPARDSMLGSGLIDKGGAVLISGPQKIGKSLFATQLALSLAGRQAFIGFNSGGEPYKTLILQAEVSERWMKKRFVKQAAGFPSEAQELVFCDCVFSKIKLDHADGAAVVDGYVEQVHPDLLIVDPLTCFHTGDENTVKDIAKVTTVLDKIRAAGVAVALVHHHSKVSPGTSNVGYKSRGSSAVPGWYDSHFSLEWTKDGKVRVRFELRNAEAPEAMLLKLNSASLLFESTEETDDDQIGQVLEAVRVLQEADADAVAVFCDRSPSWASTWLSKAVDDGKLDTAQASPSGRGRPRTLYRLPGESIPPTIAISTNTSQVSVNGQVVFDPPQTENLPVVTFGSNGG